MYCEEETNFSNKPVKSSNTSWNLTYKNSCIWLAMSLVSVQKKTLNLLSYGYQRVSGKTVCKGAEIRIMWKGITHILSSYAI